MSIPEGELIERLRRAYERFNAEDFDAAVEMAHPEFETAGSRVLVRQHATARGAVSGIEVEIESWALWTFDDDGRATRMEFFLNHEEDEVRRALREA